MQDSIVMQGTVELALAAVHHGDLITIGSPFVSGGPTDDTLWRACYWSVKRKRVAVCLISVLTVETVWIKEVLCCNTNSLSFTEQ